MVEAGCWQITNQPVPVLAHRWSFNGSLADSAATNNATVVDAGANNATLTASNITLTGGTQSASDYVSLGGGLLPKDGTAVTIELWATPLSVQNWSRIFDAGSSTTENLFMSWSQGTDAAQDRVEWKDGVTTTVNNTCAPYAAGTEVHLAMVIEPNAGSNGLTRVTWYCAPAAGATLGAARGTFDTANTLASFNDANFWLGRSEYSDATANASYNEARLWSRAFSAAELQQLHALGPDALGTFAVGASLGAFSAASDLSILAGAQVKLDGAGQQVASLSGQAGSVLEFNGGQMRIMSGGNAAATFAGSLAGNGSLVVEGVLRLVGDAALAPDITLTNNGTLDLMTWSGRLPDGFVNHGTVLDRSLVRMDSFALRSKKFNVTIHGYRGHNYQLQWAGSLSSGVWQNVGAPSAGADAPISFTQPPEAGAAARFYRIMVSP